MSERLSRKQLYDLVWSEPMRTLSARFGISDVGLEKTCAKAEVPTPDRGYWAKKEAGKTTFQIALPDRAPGMDDEVLVAGGSSYWYGGWSNEELLEPVPPPPEFPEQIEAVRERIATVVGTVKVPREVSTWHPAIDRLLKEDERRREKQRTASYPVSWDNPRFDSPLERRRLRILNSLFLAAGRFNGKPTITGHEATDIHLSFYQQYVPIRLCQSKQSSRQGQASTIQPRPNDTQLSLSILESSSSDKHEITWQDDDGKLEARMTEITIQIILTAEVRHRESAIRKHLWRIERKAQLEQEERQRKLAAERAERERQQRLAQARINRLLRDAAAFQQAADIRKYIDAIRLVHNETASKEELENWAKWALAQADRIDPAIGGGFLTAMQDENDTKK